MLNKSKRYLVISAASLVLYGCGTTNSVDVNDIAVKGVQDLGTFNDAEELAYVIANQQNIIKNYSNKNKNVRSVDLCENSGTIEMSDENMSDENMNDGNMDDENMDDENMDNGNMDNGNMDGGMMSRGMGASNHKTSTMKYTECMQNDEILNGEMKFSTDSSSEAGSITYMTDFTYIGKEDEMFIEAGGNIKMHKDGEWEVLTINLKMRFNGITREGKDLIYRGKELDGGFIEFPVSGKEKIEESAYFTVDPMYDASKTPFKTNNKDELISGMFKYINEHNNSIELEITAKDTVTVRVDRDSDGKFSQNEMSTINLIK